MANYIIKCDNCKKPNIKVYINLINYKLYKLHVVIARKAIHILIY